MSKSAYKFAMTLVTAGSVGFALGVGATGAAVVSGLFCAIFSYLLFGPDFAYLRSPTNK